MKIGLISYHCEPNYGTMLQAYALSKALNVLGVENEYILYKNSEKPSVLFKILRFLVRLIIPANPSQFDFFHGKEFESTFKAFNNFHDFYIPTSSQTYYINTIKNANFKYDNFIVGSDQTWSEYMNRSGMSANFLEFVVDDLKKNSYAPSIGSLNISEEFSNALKKRIQSFNHISCREKQNCENLSKLIGKKVEYVLDPTLLLSAKEWNEIAITPSLPPKKYVLAYILGEKKCIAEYAESLGKKLGLPVYYILTRPKYLEKENCLKGVGPADFVGLIRDAAYVVTDSFHGTAFCINYGTQVYCFTKREVSSNESALDNDRIKLLLSEFGLEHRQKEDDDTMFENDFEPQSYYKHLECFRRFSWDYLKNIIQDEDYLHKP